MKSFIGSIILLLCLSTCAYCFGCHNEKNEPQSWLLGFRVPNSRNYMVWESSNQKFRVVDETILKGIYSKASLTENKLLIWNDQPVDIKTSSSVAHAKGNLHYEPGRNGFVFLHSIPELPDTTKGFINWESKETSSYGQSFICVTLTKPEEIDAVLTHVYAENAYIVNDTFKDKKEVDPKKTTLRSNLGNGFTLVTKSSKSVEHVFEEFMKNAFNTGWFINTWSRPYKESSCGGDKPISNIIFKNLNGVVMKSTQDHAKWALSVGTKDRIVCIGDLNHMDSQRTRGGSFMCIDNPLLYKELYSTFLNDECNLLEKYRP